MMGIVTWSKAHIFHNTDSMVKLALKDSYDIQKVESHIASKLKTIRNCENNYKAEKLNHYLTMQVKLDLKKESIIQLYHDANNKQKKAEISTPVTVSPDSLALAQKSEADKLKQEMLNMLGSPEEIAHNLSGLNKHINHLLSCDTYQSAVGINKMRSVTTLLQGLSVTQPQATSLLQEKVEGKGFVEYGDPQKQLASEQEWSAVKTHLTKIQLWGQEMQETYAVRD
ncbi:hypothetical protein [Citrobacter amalonaticus]|nr:hypothetical protein [Citrobacter amalonaticus]